MSRSKHGAPVHENERYLFECELTEAVNPVTYSTCRLSPPVRLHSFEDLDQFNDKWEEFCENAWHIAKVDPAEVSFCLA